MKLLIALTSLLASTQAFAHVGAHETFSLMSLVHHMLSSPIHLMLSVAVLLMLGLGVRYLAKPTKVRRAR